MVMAFSDHDLVIMHVQIQLAQVTGIAGVAYQQRVFLEGRVDQAVARLKIVKAQASKIGPGMNKVSITVGPIQHGSEIHIVRGLP